MSREHDVEIYENPLTRGWDDLPAVPVGNYYTHFEICPMRVWQCPDGEMTVEQLTEEDEFEDDPPGMAAGSPVFWTLFGRFNFGGRETIGDSPSKQRAKDCLASMGVVELELVSSDGEQGYPGGELELPDGG